MMRKQLLPIVFITGFFLIPLLFSRDKPVTPSAEPGKPVQKTTEPGDPTSSTGADLLKVLLGMILGGGILTYIQYYRRNKDAAQKKLAELKAEKDFLKKEKEKEKSSADKTAEEVYGAALKEELGFIHALGSPQFEGKAVKLEQAFVPLRISQHWRSDNRFEKCLEMPMDPQEPHEPDCHFSPEEVMTQAFKQYRLLLIIGDPGSGKTTLLKYYALACLDTQGQKYRRLGFAKEILPVYFPLRELEFADRDEPGPLPQGLAAWCERHLLNIPAERFYSWLRERETLVLLDGLDEISRKEQRRKVCQWINRLHTGFGKARFVVTSRATGYRKLDGIELASPHLRADIIDFTPGQQDEFLKKWFRAIFLSGVPPAEMSEQEWRQRQKRRADQRSKTIIDFLKKEENKAVQELAAVPMLLQIMTIIWKDRKHLPKTRRELFDAALNYLLAYRDREKEIEPVLPAESSRRVLAPTALWMQEVLHKDEAPKEEMHRVMQPVLATLEGQPAAADFCDYLRDRAGLIADYDRDHYIFRHKSFREFLAGVQLVKTAGQQGRIESLIEYFKQDWWEESLRFFMSLADDEIFDRFMRFFFQSPLSRELDAHQHTLLQHLVREAPQKKIDALAASLNSDALNARQRRCVLDCLKIIATPEAIKAIENADKTKMEKSNLSYARDIIAETSAKQEPLIQAAGTTGPLFQETFRNFIEGNVEYLRIPGGSYRYSVSKQKVTVPDLYFCKYPVTNKRYRRFISYLAGSEKELEKELSLKIFSQRLLEFAKDIKGFNEHLGKKSPGWKSTSSSQYDEDKKFNGNDQPVVGVSWYAARAYCFWLSCLDAVLTGDIQLLKVDIVGLASLYRLPIEEEWEWAAFGEPDGSLRKYPWAEDKGELNKNLTNYNGHVDATTPVGRYPEGATPHGLMDMAGNVWEWMENYYDEDKNSMALRGGAFYSEGGSLVCPARDGDNPRLSWRSSIGFRVLRLAPPVR